MTSTMKSEPGRPSVSTSRDAGVVSVSAASAPAGRGISATTGIGACSATAFEGAAKAAAPAAAPFRNPRRLSLLVLGVFMRILLILASEFLRRRVYIADYRSQ